MPSLCGCFVDVQTKSREFIESESESSGHSAGLDVAVHVCRLSWVVFGHGEGMSRMI